jgi:hypothetical protein
MIHFSVDELAPAAGRHAAPNRTDVLVLVYQLQAFLARPDQEKTIREPRLIVYGRMNQATPVGARHKPHTTSVIPSLRGIYWIYRECR